MNEVIIKSGYRFEVSKRSENELALVEYNNDDGKVIDTVPAISINSYAEAWRFIERHIGSSTKCDFTEEAVKKIFN